MKEKKIKTYIPSISYNGKKMSFKDMPLGVASSKKHKCEFCDDKITFSQVKKVVPTAEEGFVEDLLVYINKYRTGYKLDTCLRKAHFIAQIGAETGFQKKNLKENHRHSSTSGILTKHSFDRKGLLDETILTSLENYLTTIFKLTDKDNKIISKTNSELKTIVKNEKISIDIRKLYARYDGVEKKIKSVKHKLKNKEGKEIEEIKYNIILKKHKAFRIPLFSKWYGPYFDGTRDRRGLGNGNELTRDGYKFCGKGLKQLTGKGNYISFSKFRKDKPFSGETAKDYIDFTLVTNSKTYEGNYNKLADEKNLIYAVQSALWFYQKGGVAKSGKYSVDWADEDNIEKISKILNGGDNGKKLRRDYSFKAREVFKVYEHYEKEYKNGNATQKSKVVRKFKELGSSKIVKSKGSYPTIKDPNKKKWQTINIDLKDLKMEKLFEKYKPKAIELPSPKGISLKIEGGNENELILNPIISGKKKRRRR
ncbi:hypothetical protein [Tenacibaculum ovolyticum]|uniref:hypothetical protein n=1 Tax=Tenacibaculum ovolyticum TaxID=104270 RepID=UPI0007EC5368|nr:hypothetical protein [Tenacibaculum ovolyticum]